MEGKTVYRRLAMPRLTDLLRRTMQIYETKGIVALLRRALAFIVYCFFEYRSYWLYAEPAAGHPHLKEANFMPKIDDFTFKIVTSNQEADELEAQGLEFRSRVPNAAEKLDKVAVAFCVFVGNELGHIVWFAMNQEAKDAFNEPPYKVDFSKSEVCSVAAWTHPKYRGMGLNRYSHFKWSQFKADKGITTSRSAIAKANIAMQRSYAGGLCLRNTLKAATSGSCGGNLGRKNRLQKISNAKTH